MRRPDDECVPRNRFRETAMIEINAFEDITRIKMSREMDGRALYWVAAYLVDGLLIDTGCSYTSEELTSFLRGKPLNRAVNTHFHEDHIGGNRQLMDAFGIDIFAHADSVPLIAREAELYPYQEVVWGYPEPTRVKPLGDTVKTGKYEFRVIETPGHSAGHVALLEESKGWCFSGDIFSRENLKFIRPEEDAAGLVASMNKILQSAPGRLVLFTSVGKIIEDGRRALTACIDNLNGLAKRARALADEGHDREEILTALFGGENAFSQLTNGQFSSRNLVNSLLAMTEQ